MYIHTDLQEPHLHLHTLSIDVTSVLHGYVRGCAHVGVFDLLCSFSPALQSNISVSHSVEWPQERRSSHAASHLSGPLFVIVGGAGKSYCHTLNDMWLCDTTTKLWTKVYTCSYLSTLHVLMFITILCNKTIHCRTP